MSHLLQLNANPADDRDLAQSIAAAAGKTEPDALLGLDLTPECLAQGSLTYYGGRLGLFTSHAVQWTRRPDFGEPVLMTRPRENHVELNSYGYLSLTSSSGDANQPVQSWSINLDAIGAIAVVIWLVWLFTRLICHIIVAITIRRRRARGQCLACGYIITAPKSA